MKRMQVVQVIFAGVRAVCPAAEPNGYNNGYNFLSVKKKHLTPFTRCCMMSKVMNMDKLARQALLYDFYGELLTEHQRRVYEDVVLNDYSLSEVAQDQGVSRQGIHDLVKRSTRTLEDYESKLHLVERFVSIREKVHEIHQLTQNYEGREISRVMAGIQELSHSILEEL